VTDPFEQHSDLLPIDIAQPKSQSTVLGKKVEKCAFYAAF
jgi:hypothetical protein